MPKNPIPKVSIGMPVYNGERYLAKALDSILAQTFSDYELIISDNASTDSTEEICREYLSRDARIQYFRNSENIGASRNYRRVFNLSSGRYYRWANHDDLFAPESLARCVEVLDRDPSIILVYPKTKLIDGDGNFTSEYEDSLNLQSTKASERFSQVWKRLGLVNVIYGLIRSDLLRKTALIGDFIASDRPFVAELSLYGKFHEISEYLFFRRVHAEAYSSQKDTEKLMQFYKPRAESNIQFTNCRHLWEAFLAVRRVPLARCEKIQLYCQVGRMLRWSRWKIAGELLNAAKHVLGFN